MGWLDGEGRRTDLQVEKIKLATNIAEEKRGTKNE